MELAEEERKIQAFKHLLALWETRGLCSLFGFYVGEGLWMDLCPVVQLFEVTEL